MKKEHTALFRNFGFAAVIISTFLPQLNSAQPDIESIARLHFRLAAAQTSWVDGYRSFVSGSYSPYQSHRSGEKRDSAFVARTNGGEAMFEWMTAPVPAKWNGDSLSFIWTCGFGNNLGKEWFDLSVNDTTVVSFATVNDGYWSVAGKKGFRLSFTAVAQNSYGANLGYMVLTVHRSLITAGKPLKVRIRGREAKEEIWYRLYPYRNIAQYIQQSERQNIYSNLDFVHMGDAAYTICADTKLKNSSVQLRTNTTLMAEGRLMSDGTVSKTVVTIPRSSQPGESAFTIITIAGKPVDTISWSAINAKRIRSFMEERIVFDRYVFPPGDFPGFRWMNEIMVEHEIGVVPLTVRYYNSLFQEVKRADSPGRYGAVIEGTTASGFVLQRFATLYCAPVELDDYSKEIPVRMNALKGYGIGKEQWDRYTSQFDQFSFGSLKSYPQHDPDAAIFLAGLRDLDVSAAVYETPRILDRQWWITLKQNLSGEPKSPIPVIIPKKSSEANNLAEVDSIIQKKYDQVKLEQLREVCRNWASNGRVPHVTLVVHKGKIIFHEAFGTDESGKPITTNAIQWMASITKLLTGVLMMQYVDQGIIDLDASISRYLPEIKRSSGKPLTVRHLFTHTTGLQFAGEWASDWNVSLENQIAHIIPTVTVEESFSYNRVGYAVAGKILERLTGRSIPSLFQQQIFAPLHMTSAFSDNSYGGLYCTAFDLAKLGMMLMNKGSFSGFYFFSPESFKNMLPGPLPVSDRTWGIGTSSLSGNGLSDETFGHGAASGSVFRIDPKNELIIISARNKTGRQHSEYEKALIERCIELIRTQ